MDEDYRKLYAAALEIYFAGHWECDRISNKESHELFRTLRKCLDITKGDKLIHLSMDG